MIKQIDINCRWRVLLVALVLVSGRGECFSQSMPLPLDPAVRTGKLSNGFTYYIRRNTEPRKRVVFYLANKIGSILETDEQLGLAHFMEHMNFNGTVHFPKNQLVDYLQKAGVRFGADINAYTGFDETVYQLPLPTDNPEVIKNGLQIMRDWAHGAALEDEEIDRERGVILEEKRLRKGAQERMQSQYLPKVLNGSRYSSRFPIGTDEVLKGFSPQTIRSFYNDWYRPNLQALIIVGEIDVDAMERDIRAKFSDLRNPVRQKERINYSSKLNGKNQFIAVSDGEVTNTTLQVLFKRYTRELKTTDDFRESIMESLINQMLADRFRELSRKPSPEFLQGTASLSPILGGLAAYTVNVVVKPGISQLEKGFKAVWRESTRMRKFGFTSGELIRAKINYQSSLEAAFREKDKISSDQYVQGYLRHFLKGTAAMSTANSHQLITKILSDIKLEVLNSKAKDYVKRSDRDILMMSSKNDASGLPDEKTINSWMADIEAEDVQPYLEQTNTRPLLSEKPVKGRIIKEQKVPEMSITTLTFSNGVNVVLKPTRYKENEIIFNGFSPGGTSLYSDEDYQSAANSAGIIGSSGVGNYNSTDLARFLTGKQASVRTAMGERSQGISGGASVKDLGVALELIYGYFTEPRADSVVFNNIITRSRAAIENRSVDPSSVFQDTISAVMGNYNPRRTGPSLEKLAQIDLEKSRRIYSERFANAHGFTFVFVGNFSIDSIKPLLEQYLGALPSVGDAVQAKDVKIRIPGGKISKTVYKGSEPKASVQLIFSGSYEHCQKNNLDLKALKEVLEIRLLERLREEEGGVYTPSVRISGVKFPEPVYTLGVSFGCSPQNVDRLIASALDEVEKLKNEGPSRENIDKFIAEDRLQRETAVGTNGYWLNYISNCLQNGEEFGMMNAYPGLLHGISSETVSKSARKYLSGTNLLRFILLPEVNNKN